jgi:hypothetical protein
MKSIIDYGDDGVIPMIDSENVNDVVNDILKYVEARLEILNKQNRRADIFALCQEFLEWGIAEDGDELFYFICPTFK